MSYLKTQTEICKISICTLRKHGEQLKQTTYIENLFRMFEMLAKRPSIARLRPETRPEIRGFKVGSHIVFFVEINVGIGIVRVLHESSDIEHAPLGSPFPNQV